MAEFSLPALHDEIEADPQSLGYKVGSVWKGDQEIADLLMAKTYTIDRESVEMEAVRAATSYDWYNNLSIDEQEWIRWQTPNSGQWRVSADMKLQLTGRTLASGGVAGSGSDADSFWQAADRADAVASMLALIEVPGSRGEVLWGEGSSVSAGQIGRAANL